MFRGGVSKRVLQWCLVGLFGTRSPGGQPRCITTGLVSVMPSEQADEKPKQPPPPATSAGGGLGAKLGDRYEQYWTVLRGVIPILRGTYSSLRIEPPDGLPFEFELTGHHSGDVDEAHQCKRSHSSSWTISALKKEGFLGGLDQWTSQGKRAVFVSEQTSIMRGLEQKAKRMSLDELPADLSRPESAAHSELMTIWGVDEAELHKRLQLISFDVASENTAHYSATEILNSMFEGDPNSALAVISQYLVDTAPRPVTAAALRSHLNDRGHRGIHGVDSDLSVTVRQTSDRYTRRVDKSRPAALPAIDRTQAREIVDLIVDREGPSTIVVTGAPGAGKSHILGQVVRGLEERDCVVGVVRLDVAQPTETADGLGRQNGIDFGGSPARVISRARAIGTGVLVVDQADSASTLSGRGTAIRAALQDLLEQARASIGLRIIIACRSEDLKFDRQLRTVLGVAAEKSDAENSQCAEIVVGDLTEADVSSALTTLGLSVSNLDPKLSALLLSPLNLALFVSLYEDGTQTGTDSLLAVRSRIALLDRYHQVKGRALAEELGTDGYATITMEIAAMMTDLGTLAVPAVRFSGRRNTIDRLIHYGVIINDGNVLRFFHESYFDYVSAIVSLNVGQSAADMLATGPQTLLRRGQVRALLTIERDQDPSSYQADLAKVLSRENRSHIRAAVLSMLTSLESVSNDELKLVLAIAADNDDKLRDIAMTYITSPPYVAALAGNGLLVHAAAQYCGDETSSSPLSPMVQLLHGLRPEQLLYILYEAARTRPDEAARAALPIAHLTDRITDWLGAMVRLVMLTGPTDSGTNVLELYETVIDAVIDAFDDASRESPGDTESPPRIGVDSLLNFIFDHGLIAVSGLIRNAPQIGPAALAVCLRAARHICDATGIGGSILGRKGPFGRRADSIEFAQCASAAPLQFIESLDQTILEELRRTVTDRRWIPLQSSMNPDDGFLDSLSVHGQRSLRGGLFDAFADSVRTVAQSAPESLIAPLALFESSDLLAAQEVVAAAYSHATGPLIDKAVDWILDPRTRGLAQGWSSGWAWGAAVARIATVGSDEQRSRVLSVVRGAYGIGVLSTTGPAPDSRLEYEEHAVLALLGRAMTAQLPDDLRTRLAELNDKNGQQPLEPTLGFAVFSPSVVEPADPIDLDDERWLKLVDEVSALDDDADDVDRVRRGLHTAAATEMARFSRLLAEFPATAPTCLVIGVLRGLTDAAKVGEHADGISIYDAVRSAFTRPVDSDLDVCITQLIQSVAHHQDLPQDIILMLDAICNIDRHPAVSEPQPDEGVATQGLQKPRGAAVLAIAEVLIPTGTRPQRLAILTPTLHRIVEDPSERVRVWLPQALRPVHMQDAALATELLRSWLSVATPHGLRAPALDHLIFQIATTHPALTVTVLKALTSSPLPDNWAYAARLITLLEVRGMDLQESGSQALLGTALETIEGRTGVADFLTQLVDELPQCTVVPDSSPCADLGLLVTLMNDPVEVVREQTQFLGNYLPESLEPFAALLDRVGMTTVFKEHPGPLFSALSDRLNEIHSTALGLCEKWTADWCDTAGNFSTSEAADAYSVIDTVLSVYARVPAGSSDRDRCLDILDRFVESGAGGASSKADDVL